MTSNFVELNDKYTYTNSELSVCYVCTPHPCRQSKQNAVTC